MAIIRETRHAFGAKFRKADAGILLKVSDLCALRSLVPALRRDRSAHSLRHVSVGGGMVIRAADPIGGDPTRYTALTFIGSPKPHSNTSRSHFPKSAAASYVLC